MTHPTTLTATPPNVDLAGCPPSSVDVLRRLEELCRDAADLYERLSPDARRWSASTPAGVLDGLDLLGPELARLNPHVRDALTAAVGDAAAAIDRAETLERTLAGVVAFVRGAHPEIEG